jgi:hypothetical protein
MVDPRRAAAGGRQSAKQRGNLLHNSVCCPSVNASSFVIFCMPIFQIMTVLPPVWVPRKNWQGSERVLVGKQGRGCWREVPCQLATRAKYMRLHTFMSSCVILVRTNHVANLTH